MFSDKFPKYVAKISAKMSGLYLNDNMQLYIGPQLPCILECRAVKTFEKNLECQLFFTPNIFLPLLSLII